VTGAAQVLEEVGRIGADLAPPVRGPEYDRDSLDHVSAILLEAAPRRRAAGPDEIAALAGVDLRAAMRKLPVLVDMGFLVRRDGGYLLATRATGSTA
jgi:DNA processing protein